MKKTIKVEKVYGQSRNDRLGVVVNLEDGKGNKFKYLPTYADIQHIMSLLAVVEKVNENKHK